jgi:hypothetical protein
LNEYDRHASAELKGVFPETQMSYRGQVPGDAKILFVGIDANYSRAISENAELFTRILEYHQDGVAFWEKYGVHHPFLLPDYPLPENSGGVPYHRCFAAMGLSSDAAAHVSFVELLNVPTTGRLTRSGFWELFSLDHGKSLNRLFLDGSRRLVIVSSTVIKYMYEARRRFEIYKWLPDRCDHGLFFRNAGTRFFKSKDFSAATSSAELKSLGELIREFYSDMPA